MFGFAPPASSAVVSSIDVDIRSGVEPSLFVASTFAPALRNAEISSGGAIAHKPLLETSGADQLRSKAERAKLARWTTMQLTNAINDLDHGEYR